MPRQVRREQHAIGPQVMSLESRPAAYTLKTEADFLRAFANAGYKDAQAMYVLMTGESPDFKLHPMNLNDLGYQLLRI